MAKKDTEAKNPTPNDISASGKLPTRRPTRTMSTRMIGMSGMPIERLSKAVLACRLAERCSLNPSSENPVNQRIWFLLS